MDCQDRNPLLVFIAFIGVIYLGYSGFRDLGPRSNWEGMLGTWTDPRGEDGNSIHIYLVPAHMPENYCGLTPFEGRVDFAQCFGENECRAHWNFESCEPIRLGVIVDQKVRYAAVRVVDHNHLLFRYSDDLEAVSRPDVFQDSETLRLIRQAEVEPPIPGNVSR